MRGYIEMFRARKPESANRTVRMPVELIEELNFLAQAKGISFNLVVSQCCRYALAELSPEQREAVEAMRRESAAKEKESALV